jgi:methyl-accepting chemotaxis protein
MPRELKDVEVQYISLVNKGANKQKLMLYKSDDYQPEEEKVVVAEPVQKSNATLLEKVMSAVKGVLIKEDDKPSFRVTMERQKAWNSLWDSYNVMRDVMYDILWWTNSETPKADIEKELDEFKKYILETLGTVGIEKSAELVKADKEKSIKVQKTESPVNAKLLKEFEQGISKLNNVFSEIKSGDVIKEEDEMKAEDIQKAMEQVLAPLTEGIESLKSDLGKVSEKVGVLEKGTEDAVQKAEDATKTAGEVTGQVEKTAEEVIKSALGPIAETLSGISETVKSVSERVEKLESVRKSSSVSGDEPAGGKEVKKTAGVFDSAFGFSGK